MVRSVRTGVHRYIVIAWLYLLCMLFSVFYVLKQSEPRTIEWTKLYFRKQGHHVEFKMKHFTSQISQMRAQAKNKNKLNKKFRMFVCVLVTCYRCMWLHLDQREQISGTSLSCIALSLRSNIQSIEIELCVACEFNRSCSMKMFRF